MLQPLQLEDVSIRYPNEIAELGDFFAKAGLTPHTPETFHAVAVRARDDRAFSRDLTSHIWVFLHTGNRRVSYSDLLGMLAIAAAGPRFAASANEADAHDLLRFLMEARAAFDAPSAARTGPSAPLPMPLAISATPAVPPPAPFLLHTGLQRNEPEIDAPLSLELPQDEDADRPIVWFSVAACALLLLFGGLWFLHSSAPNRSASLAAPTGPAPVTSAPAVAATHDAASPLQRHQEIALPHGRSSRHAPAPVAAYAPPVAGSSSQPASAPVPASAYTPPSAPANRLSKPSPSTSYPSMAKAAPAEARTPRLLRRPATVPPVVPVSPLDGSDSRTGNTPTGGSVRQATVRATSLGTMAGNVTYSPAPAYPAAASALHVQGEVKLEAEVDPSGSVVSTRIISGPPLLQEAAADAVQRWRYHPFLYNDKPIGMNTTVVMDFQLP